jgi:UDP-glucose:(heptosyl)LPS alpha-1,3-glucosyltransferase
MLATLHGCVFRFVAAGAQMASVSARDRPPGEAHAAAKRTDARLACGRGERFVNVALAIERMDPFRGGRETSVAQLAGELARRGHRVTILCMRGTWPPGEGIEVRQLMPQRETKSAGAMRAFIDRAGRLAEEFDVLHATLPIPGANVYQLRSGTIPGQVEATFRRRSMLRNMLSRVAGRWKAKRKLLGECEREVAADPRCRLLAVSNMVAEELQRFYDAEARTRVILNAVEAVQFDPPGRQAMRRAMRERHDLSADAVILLTAATNFPLKGVDWLIRALGAWNRRRGARSADVRLLAVGTPRPGRYRRLARRCGIGARVVVDGPVAADVMPLCYAAADAVALLSWYDPCSRVVLEGLRAGLPGLTTLHNGAAEVLVRHGAGEIVNLPSDVDDVAGAIEKLADARHRDRLADGCSEAVDEVSLTRHVDALLDVYEEVAAS